MTGKVTFSLTARADLTDAEANNVKRYKFGSAVLYSKERIAPSALPYTWGGIARNFAAAALNLKITVDDLINGKVVECKDIIEMRAAEEQIKEACEVLKEVLESAARFGGEEVIEF